MGWREIVLLLMLASARAGAQPPVVSGADVTGRTIFLPPPVRWDSAMLSNRPVARQTPMDFANVTGGLAFGLSPATLNGRLAKPYPGLAWNALSLAAEYADDVRAFALTLDAANPLRAAVTACTGQRASVVLLFSRRGLFRLSYRLPEDQGCPDTGEAARQILGRYVPVSQSVALSMRYRSGATEVVDITDPAAGELISTRWRQARP